MVVVNEGNSFQFCMNLFSQKNESAFLNKLSNIIWKPIALVFKRPDILEITDNLIWKC